MTSGPTYTPIATQTTSGSTGAVTFSSIPNTYTDLVVVINTSLSGLCNSLLQFNGDTGSNYSGTVIVGNGSTATSGRNSNLTFSYLGLYNASIGNLILNIQNYSNTTTYKTLLTRSNNSQYIESYVSLWRSTAAINSIYLTQDSGGNFSAGSTFTLYGISAA